MSGSSTPDRKFVYRRDKVSGPPKRLKSNLDRYSECLIKDVCQSCKYVNLDYTTSLQEKYQAGIKHLAANKVINSARHLPPEPSPRKLAYRSVAKLAVRPKKDATQEDRFAIGLFQPNSHKVIEIGQCPLHVPAIGRFIRALNFHLNHSSLQPWDEKSRLGDLRYVVVRASHLTQELMVVFVVSSAKREELKQIVSLLRLDEHKINSAHMNVNAAETNAIFGPETLRIAGTDKLRETICDLNFEISPSAFFQVNPWQAINLYRRIEQIAGEVATNSYAWDLYCGGGQIAMMLGRLGYNVIAIEENPAAVLDGEANARRNALHSRIQFIAGRVEDVQNTIPPGASYPDLIVVNPSRRGIAKESRDLIKNVLANSPKTRLIYVSCEVESLARDLVDIVSSGHKVRQVEAFDMFAQTDKLEWIAVLTS
jgi:23S rRNA (uracil1939-C5)-methyltransferase